MPRVVISPYQNTHQRGSSDHHRLSHEAPYASYPARDTARPRTVQQFRQVLPLGRVKVMHRTNLRVTQVIHGRHRWLLPWPVISARVAGTDANGNRAAGFVGPWALQLQRLGVSPAKPRGPVSDRAKRRDQAAKRRLGPAGLAT